MAHYINLYDIYSDLIEFQALIRKIRRSRSWNLVYNFWDYSCQICIKSALLKSAFDDEFNGYLCCG